MCDFSTIIQDLHTADCTVNAMFHFLKFLPTNWTTSRSQRAGTAFCHKGPVGTPFPGGMFLESFGKRRVWETEKRYFKIWSPPLREFGPTQPRPITSPLKRPPADGFPAGNFISGWWRISFSQETHPLRKFSCCRSMRVIMGRGKIVYVITLGVISLFVWSGFIRK